MNVDAKRLILRSFQSPGDILMLTAAVRDLHRAYPGRFETDVRTSTDPIWENNPHLTRLDEAAPGVELLDMHYPLVHQSNRRPYHFIHGYVHFLEERLGLRIPVTECHADIWLSERERNEPLPTDWGLPDRFWIVMAGGKHDFTAKWWNPASYQAVVDHFRERIHFVQCGARQHWHPRLVGVTDLVGGTDIRQFIRLMHHAEGVVCPVTFAMHLAAAVETRPGRSPRRPAVVIAGGREPAHWEAYSHHQFIGNNGALPCCADGGCWKAGCDPSSERIGKSRSDACLMPVRISRDLQIPKCMDLIGPAEVIGRIETYFDGGALSHSTERLTAPTEVRRDIRPTRSRCAGGRPNLDLQSGDILLRFRHGLGDTVQLTSVLKHLAHYYPEKNIDVAAPLGRHSACSGLCRKVFVLGQDRLRESAYGRVVPVEWHECESVYPNWPSTKVARCLLEEFRLRPIPQLCRYTIRPDESAERVADQYLASICKTGPNDQGRYRTVLIHYQGDTSRDRKDLPEDLIRRVCRTVFDAGAVPVILDWHGHSPLIDGSHIHNAGTSRLLWGESRTGDAQVMAALTEASTLLVGIDSGPLHVAGATSTPTLGVWTKNHPVHFFDLADNVLHLIPQAGPAGIAHDAIEFFRTHYRHRVYRQLDSDLPKLVSHCLREEPSI